MPRPRNPNPNIPIQLSLEPTIAAKLEILAFDANKPGRIAYGVRSRVVEQALREYFDRIEARQETQPEEAA